MSRAFFGVFAGMVLEAGEVYIDADHQGVALWLPFDPSEQHDSSELQAAFDEAIGPFRERGNTIDALMAEAHPDHVVHAYLPFIGVAERGQGRGVGAALLASRTHQLDQQGLPAYLEATTREAARLYERHGFRHMDRTIDLPNGPSMYPMWRDAG
ncbi:MAG TPA: GNAT family N-acetyltransferase [Tepidiformaceae bacterium]|nr:GNAT family N-acetyltransferase [Tepidiformaceae bacterium]